MKVRHWKRSGFKCDHEGHNIEAALREALRCGGLSEAGVPLMKVLLEDQGQAHFVVPGVDTYVFRLVGRHQR